LPDYLNLKNPVNHVTAYVLIEASDVRKFEQPNIDHFPCLFCISKATGQSIWVS